MHQFGTAYRSITHQTGSYCSCLPTQIHPELEALKKVDEIKTDILQHRSDEKLSETVPSLHVVLN